MLIMAVSLLSSCTKDKTHKKENDIIAATTIDYNVKMCDIQKYAEDPLYRYDI